MMGLVVEEMSESGPEGLHHVHRAHEHAIAKFSGEVLLREAGVIALEALVLHLSGGPEARQVLVHGLVEARGLRPFPGEAPQPDAVADDEVIERAAERAEE